MQENSKLPPATIIINFHNEGVYAHKSLLGFQRIRDYSALQGNRVDLICVLDNADKLTKRIVSNFVQKSGTKNDQMIETDFGSLSAARNVGIDHTKTEYVGFNDGDDFFSANRIEEMLKAQIISQQPILCFPEKIISFGVKAESQTITNSRHLPMIQMLNYHFWTYASFAPTWIYQNHPFHESIGKNSKFAFEDWDFNLRCIAANIELTPIKDTYMFYRRRENSMLTEHIAYNSFVPPSSFFDNIRV